MDSRRALTVLMAVAAVVAAAIPSTASAKKPSKAPVVSELATFAPGCSAVCGSGSTVGPDKALYVTDGLGGRVLRVDPKTGTVTTFASGLPPMIPAVGIGGAMDVAFFGGTAYVLVSVVGPFFGQNDVVDGLYKIGKNGTPTVVADLGAWAIAHPPTTAFDISTGVQYALQKFRGGFLVTDGHHNRVLRVSRKGAISQMIQFGDIVPTGLAVHGKRIYMAEAGPVPHLPADGKVVKFTPKTTATQVASGAPLLVDVEFGRGRQLFALSQGIWDLPNDPANAGKPASANTGKLLRVKKDGTLMSIADALDRPTSVEFIGNTAYVITLTGKVIKVTNAGGPPFGKSH
jgi:sugar lactone lactonase YvrE